MNSFIAALQFLTVLPIVRSDAFAPERMLPFFPAAGLVIGLLLALFDTVAGAFWSRHAVSGLDVVFLAGITGALHLDGLGDTADGLYGNRPRERALEIMKDSRIGAMGLVMVVCVLGLKWAGLGDLAQSRFLFLMLIPAYARAGMLFAFRLLPYGRPEGGTGHAFFQKPLAVEDFWGLGLLFLISLFCGGRGILLNLAFLAATGAILWYYHRKMGCVTGDMLGAMTEMTECALFLAVAMGSAP